MRLPYFVNGSDTSLSPIANCSRTVNYYVEQVGPGGKNEAALYPTPGQQQVLTVADVGTRALFAMNSRTFACIGTGFYELFPSSMTATRWGTVAQDNNPAQITSNGASGGALAIASGGNLYYFVLASNTFSQVAGVPALQVGMLDSYFIAFDPGTAKIRLSPLNDATGVWDGSQFAQRSIAPDPWKAMLAADRLGTRELWLIGEQTGEVWYDAGNFPFPFAPIPGAIFKYGTCAPFSVQVAGSLVIWLTQNADGAGQVVAARGYTPQPISTKAVESAISSYARTSTIRDAEAMTLQIEGHSWYVLKFPTANATWVYDVTTSLWFEMGTWNSAQNRYDAWNPRVHCFTGSQHLVGESGTGTISLLDISYGTEADGSAIRRVRRYPGIFSEGRFTTYRRHEVKLEPGLGVQTGQGTNPQIALRTSDDGGKTWSRERLCGVGREGQYLTRVFWTRLGTARDRIFELVATDPIPYRLLDAYINNDVAAPQGAQVA